MAAAMRHEAPDRVPVMCQLALGHYFLHSDRAPSEIWFDSRCFVETLADFRRRYGHDGFLINLPSRPPDWRSYLAGHDRTAAGERLLWQNGLVTFVPCDDNPHTFARGGGQLPRADYTAVDPDDPAVYRLPGYVWNTWHAPTLWDIPPDADLTNPASYPDWFGAELRLARQLSPDASIHVEVFSPFTHLLECFSYEQALMALVESPATCHAMLDRFTRIVEAQLIRYLRFEPDAVLISSAFAGGGFVSRKMYEEFVLPYEGRVVAKAHASAQLIYTHTCGAIGDRLDLMLATGIDGIDALDPPPLGTVDLATAKRQYGDRCFFKGNLDAVNEMLRANEATFDAAVRQRLRAAAAHSGYILSSACSVSPAVAPARLQRMVHLAEEYGRHPLPASI
jgi:hypothetical protein